MMWHLITIDLLYTYFQVKFYIFCPNSSKDRKKIKHNCLNFSFIQYIGISKYTSENNGNYNKHMTINVFLIIRLSCIMYTQIPHDMSIGLNDLI